MPATIKIIDENECLGDSLPKINSNAVILNTIVNSILNATIVDSNDAINLLNTIKSALNELPN